MVIIGKQPVVDSDGEDVLQVRHKGAPRSEICSYHVYCLIVNI